MGNHVLLRFGLEGYLDHQGALESSWAAVKGRKVQHGGVLDDTMVASLMT